MIRTAHAVWDGGLKDGKGVVSTQSTALNGMQYSFRTRFEDGVGVNPEELIAAAHASCFSMALSAQLGDRGISGKVDTTAAVTMENLAITKSALTTTVTAPGADRAKIEEAAHAAKEGCPISKVLNAEITLDLTIDA
ncbi:OsmC family protein [Fimbriimonas ginsengisoli]|uniref:Putative OsmC-like protein n=1 Tax=Fimbriimonas ginsengisoli Gsoil 348 TaxID=661478 RepID=A0A068NPL5_FIMGI|nr:OsmC family protein [Fimbriimonas ginsengisoli]AIE84685.1 putative OsmC-like protein [Fimbriimonas ginsengisoli Gsoil 348]